MKKLRNYIVFIVLATLLAFAGIFFLCSDRLILNNNSNLNFVHENHNKSEAAVTVHLSTNLPDPNGWYSRWAEYSGTAYVGGSITLKVYEKPPASGGRFWEYSGLAAIRVTIDNIHYTYQYYYDGSSSGEKYVDIPIYGETWIEVNGYGGHYSSTINFTAQTENSAGGYDDSEVGGTVSINQTSIMSPESCYASSNPGYIFDGWYQVKWNSPNTYEYYSYSNELNPSGIYDYAYFYARFRKITEYYIDFIDEEEGYLNYQTLTVDENCQLAAITSTKTGYYFNGWEFNYNSQCYSENVFVKDTGIDGNGVVGTYSEYYANKEMLPCANFSGKDLELTSNYTVCGIYAYDINKNFIKRCSSYTTKHLIPSGTYYIRMELHTSNLAFESRGNLKVTRKFSDRETVYNLVSPGRYTTLYATWAKERYNVTFYKDYGISSGSTNVYYEDTIPFPSVSKDGYSLINWLNSTNSNTYNSGDTMPDVGDDGGGSNFIAQWSAKTYSVKLDNQSASTAGTTNLTATFDKAVDNIIIPKRNGYTFGGYFTEREGNGTQYITASGSSAKVWNLHEGSEGYTNESGKSNFTLYAKWTVNQYTVGLDKQGGIGGTDKIVVTFDSNELLINGNRAEKVENPTKEGCVFLGYYTKPNEEGFQFIQANGRNWASWDLHEESEGYINEAGKSNFTLYAAWQTTWVAYASTSLTGVNGEESKGEKTNPYKIATASDLAFLAKEVNRGNSFAEKYFAQTSTIDLAGEMWIPIGGYVLEGNGNYFSGTYDGQGFMLKNLNTVFIVETGYSNVGLFGYCKNAILKNINIINGRIGGDCNVGAIVGYAEGGKLENCRNGAEAAGSYNVGMIGKVNKTQMIGCYNYGFINGPYNCMGGLIGYIAGKPEDDTPVIKNCFAKCSVNGMYNIGGLVGYCEDGGVKISTSGFIDTGGSCYDEGIGPSEIIYDNCFSITNGSQAFFGKDDTIKWTTINGYQLPEGLVWVA